MISPDKEGPLLTLVVAVALNGVIGKDGGLAWRISDDLKWFKRVTMGKPIVMGRKTYDSIGRPLPGRENIVISRGQYDQTPGGDVAVGAVKYFSSIDAGLAAAGQCAALSGATETCVIGGGAIYKELLPRADRIYFTKVNANVEGDVSFPAIDSSQWRIIKVGGAEKSEKNEYSCEFFIMDRGKKAA